MTTIKDVAKAANVSIATVSYVLNNKGRIAKATEELVLKTVERLNYRPNRMAQSLVTKSTQTIAVLISDITNPLFSPIVKAIEDEANKSDYNVIICNSDENSDRSSRYLKILGQNHVDGLIISPDPDFRTLLPEIQNMNIPVVLMNRRLNRFDVVESDNESGAYQAVRHLCSLNHKRIGIIVYPIDVSTSRDRLRGYKKALEEYGIPVKESYIRILKTHIDSGYAEAKELLAMKHRPTAIFSASGPVNRGTFKAIRDSGVSIPQELSFIAFNETEWSTLVIPKITTISQQTYAIGMEAAKVLMKRIAERRAGSQSQGRASGQKKQQKKKKLHRIRIEPELIIRESTASV